MLLKVKKLFCMISNKMTQISLFLFLLWMQVTPVYAAGNIANSVFAKGTLKMFNDGASAVKKLGIAGAVLCVVAYGLLKMFADDMEDKGWNKRIKRAIIGCIVVLSGSALVEMFTGYYV